MTSGNMCNLLVCWTWYISLGKTLIIYKGPQCFGCRLDVLPTTGFVVITTLICSMIAKPRVSMLQTTKSGCITILKCIPLCIFELERIKHDENPVLIKPWYLYINLYIYIFNLWPTQFSNMYCVKILSWYLKPVFLAETYLTWVDIFHMCAHQFDIWTFVWSFWFPTITNDMTIDRNYNWNIYILNHYKYY